jgi:hypothetical protein
VTEFHNIIAQFFGGHGEPPFVAEVAHTQAYKSNVPPGIMAGGFAGKKQGAGT